ncbi:MAG: nucleotidyltransferase domain-containing protein [Methylophilaceae bacterium]|nr:MAG: nucleotidyltransferase domain-containing protein [Methylophilaceae bacterium]
MRISHRDAETISRIVSSHDPVAVVKLFGSQVRDDAAGGDIDLLILSSRISLFERLQIESDLQDVFGVRQFDIIVARPETVDPFVRLVSNEAVAL